MSIYNCIKEQAYEANMEIPKQHLALYTWGNVSAFDRSAGVFAIKPSGVPYPELTVDSMVVVDVEGKVVEGNLRPSSDTPTHAVLYKEFALAQGADIGGIIHTHSTFAVSWAQALRPVPLFGTTHADHIQVPVPCTPILSREAVQRDYEKETGLLVVKHFAELGLNPAEVNMVLVGGHGPFAWGSSAAKAVYNGAVLEEVCHMALNTLTLNPDAEELASYVVEKHYLRKHGAGAYYGQSGTREK